MGTENKNKIKEAFVEGQSEELPEDENLKSQAIRNKVGIEHSKSMTDHSKQYTDLLQGYIDRTSESAKQKKTFKQIFFCVAISTLISSFCLFIGIIIYVVKSKFNDIDATVLSGLASALVGVLSLYIIIPKIIAEYLFNIKEDESMARVVESIQTYDEKVFSTMNNRSFGEKLEKSGTKSILSDLKETVKQEQGSETKSANDFAGGKDLEETLEEGGSNNEQ